MEGVLGVEDCVTVRVDGSARLEELEGRRSVFGFGFGGGGGRSERASGL